MEWWEKEEVRRACDTFSHRDPGGNKVTLVQEENEVLVGLLFLQVLLNVCGSGSHRISAIKHLEVMHGHHRVNEHHTCACACT